MVNAASPLKDLVLENIVIKTYAYDDGAAAANIYGSGNFEAIRVIVGASEDSFRRAVG